MALIRCEDCGHKVSSLAFACPRCARPIAALHARTEPAGATGRPPVPEAVMDRAPKTDEPSASLPASIDAWRGQLLMARESARTGAVKTCAQCSVDVSLDEFRARHGDGYLCSDCNEVTLRRKEARRLATRKLLVTMAVVVGLTATAGVAAVSTGRAARHGLFDKKP